MESNNQCHSITVVEISNWDAPVL